MSVTRAPDSHGVCIPAVLNFDSARGAPARLR